MKTMALTDSLIKIMEILADIYNNEDDHVEITEDNAIMYNGHEFYVSNDFFNTVVVDGCAYTVANWCEYSVNGEYISSVKYIADLLAE